MNKLSTFSIHYTPICGLLALFILVWAVSARAELYRWTDSSGNVHVADDLFNVPQEYLSQIKTYQESKGPEQYGDIPLKKTDAGYVVKAKLNGTDEVSLILDTGATATVISPGALKKAGIKISGDKQVVLRTASGELKVGTAEVLAIYLEGWRRGPLRVVAHDAVPGFDGLLGMDFLGAYRFEILNYGPKLRLSVP